MSMLDAFDYRSLLACESLLALVLAVVFLGTHRVFPEVRGLRSAAIAFLLVLPDTILIAWYGQLAQVVSVLMANTLLLGSLIAMYEAVVAFAGGPNRRWWLWLVAFVSFGAGYFFTEIRPEIVPCLVAVALAMAAIRGFTALALLRRSPRSIHRTALRLFGVFMALLAGFDSYRAWTMFVHRAMQGRTEQAATRVAIGGVWCLAASGLGFLILISRELASRRRLETQRDSLTGTYNRRGLEATLALELERFRDEKQIFSIALVELDDLPAIREQPSHAAAQDAIHAVAVTMANQLRGSDHIGRFSRDEFLLVFAGTGEKEASIGLDRIAAEVRKLSFGDKGQPLTLSVGVTEAAIGDSAARLVARAERALQRAKDAGYNGHRALPATDPGPAGDTVKVA